MSIFSNNIIEDPWVGMAYKFWNCTNPSYKTPVWSDAFKINFSRTKLQSIVKSLLLRNDGSMKIKEFDFDEMNEELSKHSIHKLEVEYKLIILICLLVSTLNEENLSSILTNCLKQTQLNRDCDVNVKIKFKEQSFTYIIIHVQTATPQRIEITLKRR